MTSPTTTRPARSGGPLAGASILVGLAVVGYGVLLVPLSVLGGVWVALIGLSVLLAGLFATAWVRARLGLSATTSRRVSLAFGTLGVALFVAFVLVNGATFEAGSASGRA